MYSDEMNAAEMPGEEMRDEDMYAEIWEILEHINTEERDRIPDEILQLIKQHRNTEYVSRIVPEDLFNPDNMDKRTVNFLTWLMIDYMADPQQREILIQTAKENARRNGTHGSTPEEKLASKIIWHMNHTDEIRLNYCYHELMDIEDLTFRKKVFKQIEDKYTDIYSFNCEDMLEITSNFLALRLKSPLSIDIDNRTCMVPAEYWCTDGIGDIWQYVGIYHGDRIEWIDEIDYIDSFQNTIFELDYAGENFLIVRIDTTYDFEGFENGVILIGMDVSSVSVKGLPGVYKQFSLYCGANWNEIPVQSYELEIAGVRYALNCELTNSLSADLTFADTNTAEKLSFTISDLNEAKIIIKVHKNNELQSHVIPAPLSEMMACYGYLDLTSPDEETGLELNLF